MGNYYVCIVAAYSISTGNTACKIRHCKTPRSRIAVKLAARVGNLFFADATKESAPPPVRVMVNAHAIYNKVGLTKTIH